VLQTAPNPAAACRRVWTARNAIRSRTQQNWKAGNEATARAKAKLSSTEILVFQWLWTAKAGALIEI